MQRTCLRITSAIVTGLGVFAVGDEAAAQTILKGAYGFTGTGNCLVAPGAPGTPTTPPVQPGFDSSLQPFGPPLFSFSFAVEGIRTFNGDGTGTVTGTAFSTAVETPMGTLFPHFLPNASSENFTFQFTYVVNSNGSWTSDMVPGTYKGTFVTGPRSASHQTQTIDKQPTLTGQIAVNGLTLTAAPHTPSVEIHTYSNGDVWPMICYQSRVFIKLQPATN